MARLADWGNDLYSGKRSYNFVGKRRIWFSIAAVLVILSILIPIVRGGFNLGIDFKGGSSFTISDVKDRSTALGEQVVEQNSPAKDIHVTNAAGNTMLVQTEKLDADQTTHLRDALAKAYGVSEKNVTTSFVGPTWGQDVSRQALLGFVAFVLLVAILMALYFRTWKMSLAAIIGLLLVLIVTVGIYAASGFEVTPSAIIGLLTILGYSLYDTVVVFDKIRENTSDYAKQNKMTFMQEVNLAINQTLVRSINTTVVAVLPIASILFIGAFMLGAGTLRDLALALFIGTIIGPLSTIFIAAPLYATLRASDDKIKHKDKSIARKKPVREHTNGAVV